ncbi:uncharacterized protein PODANS_3_2430 [Podospora anserina S mat+]|uniref:Podospora anserina S mat+ genomic DNA chromosome 3, supercontig 2 n=1 Tax=Podospora anserina (strain S / ATCC MYA-4624 / DSM 980 / FGSC 10383) TaxID=515849 RepID=B2AZU0_PODAN|nr:uncharacterized protein PODANS_3_2430 [Podospora anserina S mat+]CAP70140.1 unnamed protein product [Podospora anserina S mat+]CDP26733.1 Putative protein of unknown function [Podospora anserina S mat+]
MKLTLSALTVALAALPELASAGFAASCSWSWQEPKYVVATCAKKDGTPWRTRQDMNLCVGVDRFTGRLVSRDTGNAFLECWNTRKDGNTDLKSTCWNWDEEEVRGNLNIDAYMQNLDGWLWCHGHRSAPY